MVSSCSAIGCRARASKDKKITFHRFPTRPDLREKWVKAVKRKNFIPTKSARLCQKHFTPDSYLLNYSNRKILKEDAVPQIFDFSSFISETDTYKPGNPELSVACTSLKDPSPINCIQFVDVDSLKCHAIPCTSNQTVIIIETNNHHDSFDEKKISIDTTSHEDPISISPQSSSEKSINSINIPSTSAKSTNSISIPSGSSASTSSSHIKNIALSASNTETYNSLNSPHDWRRQQFIIKAYQMKNKYQERLKVMNHVNRQLRKRKAFLENLLIRIKEKQLTNDDDAVDLIDCFVEEESYDSDEESSDEGSTETEDKFFGMIDDKITMATNLGKNQNENSDCEMFAAYVESMLNVMPEKDVTAVKNRIKELVNAYKGKKLIRMSKKFDAAFSGLENIEINEN